MAKWGEGDPRWIVEERPDATNVNNWHWTEKNATPWSKERMQQLFKGMNIEQDGIVCTIDNIDKCTGEASANNRKGKLIFFYEWELVLKWSGKLEGSSMDSHKGKVTIPNLSEENDLDEVEITVTIDESNDESETLKQFMYNFGRDCIRKQLGVYIKELKEEYSKNLILPKKGDKGGVIQLPKAKDDLSNDASDLSMSGNNKNHNVKKDVRSNTDNTNVGCKLDVRTLIMTKNFHCSANDLYNVLTKSDMLTAFTHGPAEAEAVRGGEFKLYSGNVQGKFEELIPEKKITQAWRLKNWPSGHYSNVIIKFKETSNGTTMTLKQTGVPAAEFNSMQTNWNRYYWHSIKRTFGFGAALANVF